MEILFEIVLYLFGELVASLIGEGLCEVASRSASGPQRRSGKALLYLILGAAAGAISLLVFPVQFLEDDGWALLNLLLTPVLAGLVMMLVGKWRRHRGDRLVPLDHFTYGYLFALAMAMVRAAWGG